MKFLFVVLALGFLLEADASFLDCSGSHWFQLSVEVKSDEVASRYIKSVGQNKSASLFNADSQPVYVVVEEKEVFKLQKGLVYEPRILMGKSLGWKKVSFTHPSDTSNSNQRADLSHLILNSVENLPRFGFSELQIESFQSKLKKCGPGRPANRASDSKAPLVFSLKIDGKLHKVEGDAAIQLNPRYNPSDRCCAN